jgi:sugar transferase (PEP-CTERM/EpsH1 system associated)
MNAAPSLPGELPDLLVLLPCLPYPCDRGDKLRWYQMLRLLSRNYRMHAACVVDARVEPAHLARIKALCYETCFISPPGLARLHTGSAAAQAHAGAPDDTLAHWIARLLRRHPIRAALACSVHMAPYLAPHASLRRVVDFVDLESERRRCAAATRRWPAAALWRRGARRLFERERALAATFDRVLFAAPTAQARFAELAPEAAHKAMALPNGVDADYFSPHILHRNPFGPGCKALVLAGAMDDHPNAEAARWFARQVFAPMRQADPSLHFYIVGARPDRRVRALECMSGVQVTGALSDLRPYLAHAALVLAPLQSDHGLQNKVLEAMAMQRPVLATPQALAGLGLRDGAEGAANFGERVLELLGADTRAVARAARARVMRDFTWSGNLSALPGLLEANGVVRAVGAT